MKQMTEYDNTNRGAAFKPFPEQQFILQGKLNMYGEDQNVALILAQSKSGEKRIEIYQKIGVMFDNEKNGNDKAPDYSGPLEGIHAKWRIAGWKGMKDDKPYMTMQLSEKQNRDTVIEPATDKPKADEYHVPDIPF